MPLIALIVCALSFTAVAAGLFIVKSAWAALLLYHLVLLTALGLNPKARPHWRELTRGFSFPAATLLTLASAGVGLFLYLTVLRLDPSGQHFAKILAQSKLSQASLIPFALYACTINPILEEWYWRGNYRDNHGSARINDLLYSLFHIPIYLPFLSVGSTLWPVLLLTVAGLIWRMTAKKLGGLCVPVIGHATGDFFILLAVAVIVGRQT